MKLTVVISAFNEEKKIAECLTSVSFADEIIVIDNTSTDGTEKIAKLHKALVFKRPNNPMLNINKNFGFGKAKGEWILSLDADERVSPMLREEIQKVLGAENDVEGYEIPRKNIIFGRTMMHTGWYPDYNLRLFKKGKGRFPEKHVHEKVVVLGKVDQLQHPLIHENYESISQFLQKTYLVYAPNEADQLIANGYVFSYRDAIRFPFQEFLGRFFLREGYKDGFHGLMLSLLMAFYHLVVFAYIWEKQKFIDEDVDGKKLLQGEIKHAKRDYRYWQYESELKSTDGQVRRAILKFRRKIPHV